MTDDVRDKAKEAMERRGLTQEQLAKEAGVRQATVSRFLSGDRNKAAEAAIAILDALGLKLVAVEADGNERKHDEPRTDQP